MTDMLEDVEPKDLGIGFPTFRQIQREAGYQAIYGEERFQGLCAPTGCGKSGIAALVQRMTGWRTAVLTATKGLQEQYLATPRDFDIADIRGKSNYDCYEMKRTRPELRLACDDGQRMGCSLKGRDGGCHYEEERNSARRSDFVVTNYAYWFAVNRFRRFGPGLELVDKETGEVRNPFECLVLDEAHAAPDQLSNFLNCSISEKEINELMEMARPEIGEDVGGWEIGEDVGGWAKWAQGRVAKVESLLAERQADLLVTRAKAVSRDIEIVRKLEKLVEKLGMMSTMVDKEWVCEYKEGTRWGRVWEFDAVWPGRYAEQFLFRGIPRVVLLSATLRPKTLGLLGIRKEVSKFTEWLKIFPGHRCPVYFLPPTKEGGKQIRIDRNTTDEDMRLWVEHIDRIIDMRTDRKGLICTVSYQRQQYFLANSRHRRSMLGNTSEKDSESSLEVYRRHVESTLPTILVSPSFSTGWDFPGKSCEFIVICKIAFPDGRSKVMKARKERDEDYPNYMAALDLVQACGRGMRFEEDQCEVFVTDGHWTWFGRKCSGFMPMGFFNSVRNWNGAGMPKPLEKL
jgi:Rad3-related DNA helicase